MIQARKKMRAALREHQKAKDDLEFSLNKVSRAAPKMLNVLNAIYPFRARLPEHIRIAIRIVIGEATGTTPADDEYNPE